MRRTTRISVVCALGLFCTSLGSNARAQTISLEHGPNEAHVLPALSPAPSGILISGSPTTPAPASTGILVPAYSSRPGAAAKLYLDFDGDVTNSWGSYSPGTTPAYDIDGDKNNFSSDELENIRQMYLAVAEAYSPFNIDVTTVNPGSLVDRQSLRVVVGGDGNNNGVSYWVGSRAGGIGYVGSFSNFQPNTVYVFPGNLRNGTPRFTAMAAVHESGHAFGLNHQSEYIGFSRVQEYSDNDPSTIGDGTGRYSNQPSAPFMGVSYFAERPIWFSGTATSVFDYQEDLSILSGSNNGFGYRLDDHGDTHAFASPLSMSGDFISDFGVIENIFDTDLFTFTITSESNAMFRVDGAPFNQMLDPSLALYDSQGELLQMIATASLSESFDILLEPGTYDLAVLSAGVYGDVGQYFLSGSIMSTTATPEPGIAGVLLILSAATLRRRRAR